MESAQRACLDDHDLKKKYAANEHYLGGEQTFRKDDFARRLFEITPMGLLADLDSRATGIGEFLLRYREDVLTSSLAYHCKWPSDEAKKFTEKVLKQAMDNASLHHGTGSFALLAMRMDRSILTLAITDDGQGIPNALRAYVRRLKNVKDSDVIRYFVGESFVADAYRDSDVIKFATQKGVTSVAGRQGVGLHYLKEHVVQRKGELVIRSGTAKVVFKANVEPETLDHLAPSPGTLLRVQLPVASSSDAFQEGQPPSSTQGGRS